PRPRPFPTITARLRHPPQLIVEVLGAYRHDDGCDTRHRPRQWSRFAAEQVPYVRAPFGVPPWRVRTDPPEEPRPVVAFLQPVPARFPSRGLRPAPIGGTPGIGTAPSGRGSSTPGTDVSGQTVHQYVVQRMHAALGCRARVGDALGKFDE